MYYGRTVFSQLVELLPRKAFDIAVQRHNGNRRVWRLSCMDQLLCMIFAQLTARSSLRETVLCLQALGARRYHCGISRSIARSTLADANEGRDYRIFQDVALHMIAKARIELPVDADLTRLQADVYALDSTTIDLCLKLFPWAGFRRHKAAVKAHTLFDLNVGIPVFIRVSQGKVHDVQMLDQFTFHSNAYYVLDRGYVDFARLYRVHTAGAFFITRAKRTMDFGVRQRRVIRPRGAVRADMLVRLRGLVSRKLYPDTLRIVRYADPDTGKRFRFLTNNPRTIALLYRKRWKGELFFKWVKQHLHIKAFFGTSANAVQTQLWIAVLVYVLVARFKQRYQLPQDMNTILQIVGVTILEKTPINQLFSTLGMQHQPPRDRNSLYLFDL